MSAFLSRDLVLNVMGVCVGAWERVRVAIGAPMGGVVGTFCGGAFGTLGGGISGATVGSTLGTGWGGIGGDDVVCTLEDRHSSGGVGCVASVGACVAVMDGVRAVMG